LQYLAGLALNSDQALRIYRHMLANNRYPERLFNGSEARLQALRKAIAPTAP